MSETILRHFDGPLYEVQGMITSSPRMLEFFERLRRVARTDASVLIRGETGTGKELVARAIHNMSPRQRGPFRALNCATLTSELIASELFGHVRGAFTGAIRDRKGLFEIANNGTLFLDEIAELPLDLQARLLRVLQEKTFTPVGATDHVKVNVRLLSATHQSLREAVANHKFRHDLMYRIRVVPLFLPPLVERGRDVEALTWRFIDEMNDAIGTRTITGITAEAMDALLAYSWPGNIRELHNVVEYAYAIGDGPTLLLDDLTPELRGEPPPQTRSAEPATEKDLERERLVQALRSARGNKTEAAQLLDISRTTLWRKLREHGISER